MVEINTQVKETEASFLQFHINVPDSDIPAPVFEEAPPADAQEGCSESSTSPALDAAPPRAASPVTDTAQTLGKRGSAAVSK
eukprot:3352354-Rhodomonas_salina.1